MAEFIDGAIMMAFAVCGLLFLRFWRRSHDRLFVMFSIAFWILAVNRLFLALLAHDDAPAQEHQTLLYVVRLVAFTIILIAVIDKNRTVRTAKT